MPTNCINTKSKSKTDISSGQLPVLTITSLFPNPYAPLKYAFNRQQIQSLSRICELGLVAPVPFTFLFKKKQKSIQPIEQHPFPIKRPVFWYVPRFKRTLQGKSYFYSTWPTVKNMAQIIKPKVIFATWLYPDGYGAMLCAQKLNLPLVLKLHGSDLLSIGQDPKRKNLIQKTLQRASALIAVSEHLKQTLIQMGTDPQKICLVGNGIDKDIFYPKDREQSCLELDLDPQKKWGLFVGNLAPVKGTEYAIKALAQTKAINLIIIGQGNLEQSLIKLTNELNLNDRVFFLGSKPHQKVAQYMRACDFLLLPSLSEGEPNVVLEALSCAKPVVASRVGGVPNLITHEKQGLLVKPGEIDQLAQALNKVITRTWESDTLMALTKERSWDKSAQKILEILKKVTEE